MNSYFEEFNLLVYYSLVGAFLDVVLWCLGPLVDDSREYGVFRLYLAAVTRKLCRLWLAHKGALPAD